MNVWLLAAAGFLPSLALNGIVCFRGDAVSRVVGLEMAGVIASLTLVALAEGFHRVPFHDVPLTLALLAFGAGLVFARFLERWL